MTATPAELASSAAEPSPGPSASNSFLANVFSFPVMCMFLLTAVIFGFCVRQFAEPDLWWHLRDASRLFEYHTLSSIDTYSFTAAGSYRPNFEWLSEVAFFLAYQLKGLQGILALYWGVLVLIYAGVYYLSCSAGSDCKNAMLATLIGIFLGVVSIGPRTLLFGWLCMVALLLILDHYRKTRTGLWLLPPLFVLWINLHGSWMFGIVVFMLTIASGLIEGEWGLVIAHKWTATELRRLLLSLSACVAVVFINPFGYKVVLYPFDLLLRQQHAVQYVEEWQGVAFDTANGKLMLLVLFGIIIAALLSRRRWRLDEVLLTAFALWAALSHARFLFFAGLVLPPVLAQRINLFPPYEREIDKPWLNAVMIAAISGCLLWFYPSHAELQREVNEHYPKAALDFMQRQQLNGKIFNQYGWGGYMEWKAPALKTFIDGRADIFVYNGVLDDHRKATSLEDPFGILDKYHIDYVLVQPDRPLTYLLNRSAEWQPIYSDKVAVIFARSAMVIQPSGMNESSSISQHSVSDN